MLYKSSRILKAPYVKVEDENFHVIDSDSLFLEKVGQLPEAAPPDDPISKYGFDPYGDGEPSHAQGEEDPSVLALFGESPGSADRQAAGGGYDGMNDPGVGGAGFDDGFSMGLNAETVDHATMGTGVANEVIERANEEAEQILAQAQDQAQQVMQQAMAEAERQAGEMLEQARAQGHSEGFEAGQAEAMAIADQAVREFDEKKRELQKEYDEKLRMIEPDLVEELTGIYEQIFTVELGSYRSLINHLITNTMHALESSQTYLIHVSPADYSALSMQKATIRKETGIPDGATMEFVEDISLSKNQCLIETDDGIFDCSLTVELAELKRKLMLLAYEGTRK